MRAMPVIRTLPITTDMVTIMYGRLMCNPHDLLVKVWTLPYIFSIWSQSSFCKRDDFTTVPSWSSFTKYIYLRNHYIYVVPILLVNIMVFLLKNNKEGKERGFSQSLNAALVATHDANDEERSTDKGP